MALTAEIYPEPRLTRTGGAGAAPGDLAIAPPPPRARSFWFELRTNATSRSVSCTPRIQGPAIIAGIQWGMGGNPDANAIYMDVGVAPSQVQEANVALGASRPWRSLFENMDPRTVNITSTLHGMPSHSIWGASSDNWWPINQLVLDPEFFLVMCLLNNAIALRITFGTIYLTEQVPPDVVRSFR